jgi:hypothetical protein
MPRPGAELQGPLAAGRAGLASLAREAASCALLFRRGDLAEARHRFGDLAGRLELVPAAARGIAQAIQDGPGEGGDAGTLLVGLVRDFGSLAPDLVSAQERRDWVMLADLLEHELGAQLACWDRLHQALAGGCPP